MQAFQRLRKLKGHKNVVNALDSTTTFNNDLLVSGSDDFTVKLWDLRDRNAVATYELDYQITSVAFSKGAFLGDYLFFGGLDNTIKALNMKKNQIEFALYGHMDTVTGIAVSPCGKYLVSNAMDNTVRVWDIRPYVQEERCIHTLFGVQHNFEKNLLRSAWNHDSTMVTGGSADRFVCVWDVSTGKESKMV